MAKSKLDVMEEKIATLEKRVRRVGYKMSHSKEARNQPYTPVHG